MTEQFAPPGSAQIPTQMPAQDPRRQALSDWLRSQDPALGLSVESLRPASSDASFRRYFRLDCAGGGSLVAMDAPPPMEDCRPFVRVARLFAQAGVHTPPIVAEDLEHGFLLLGDLGQTTYLEALQAGADAGGLYRDALQSLVRIQAATRANVLPPYDRERLLTEMRLFPDWYAARHLGAALSDEERNSLEAIFGMLAGAALAQTPVYVHRDYHSRNLMVSPGANPGILDFQDAVAGPAAYDLVSLLRDAYVQWDEETQLDWAARYWEIARAAGLPVNGDFGEFWREFEWIGLQRGLKVLGIFARLCHRDGKDRYLADLPVVMAHTRAVVERYRAFDPLRRLLDRLEHP